MIFKSYNPILYSQYKYKFTPILRSWCTCSASWRAQVAEVKQSYNTDIIARTRCQCCSESTGNTGKLRVDRPGRQRRASAFQRWWNLKLKFEHLWWCSCNGKRGMRTEYNPTSAHSLWPLCQWHLIADRATVIKSERTELLKTMWV